MMYCGDNRLTERAKPLVSELIIFCNEKWANYGPHDGEMLENNIAEWEAWSQAESHRRTGYCIWVCSPKLSKMDEKGANCSSAIGLYVCIPISATAITFIGRCESCCSLPGSALGL
jgi:hypothetical protein